MELALLEQLARLTVRGELLKLDREIWSIPRAATGAAGTRDNLAAGRLDLHRDALIEMARRATGTTAEPEPGKKQRTSARWIGIIRADLAALQ